MMAERSSPVMILSMDIVGDCASDGHVPGPGRDRQKPAVGNGGLKDVGQQHSGVATQESGPRIKGTDFRMRFQCRR